MDSSRTSTRSRSHPPVRTAEKPSVSPVFPLLLLESLRDRDRPEEILEDEDISLSLPRRLGLSEVVRVQIHRLEGEVKLRRPQIASHVEDLVRLVIRRPDAEQIFLEVGGSVARRYWQERSAWMRRIIRLLPRPLALISAQRAGRRMFAELTGPSRVKITRRPVTLRIEGALTSRADPRGGACAFYTGALTELLEQYTSRKYTVLHPTCAAKPPSEFCEWIVLVRGF